MLRLIFHCGKVRRMKLDLYLRQAAILLLVCMYLFFSVVDAWFILEKNVPFSISMLILPLIMVFSLKTFLQQIRIVDIHIFLLYFIFLVFLFMISNELALGAFSVLLVYPLLCMVFYYLALSYNFKNVFFALAAAVAVVCFLVIINNISYLQGRLSLAVGYNPTFFAGMLVGVIYGALYFYQRYGLFSKVVVSLSLAVIGYALVGTGARNALLALSLSFFAVLVLRLPRLLLGRKINKSSLVFILMLLLVSVFVFFMSGFFDTVSEFQVDMDRFSRTLSSESSADEATAGRATIWKEYITALNYGAMFYGLEGAPNAVVSGRPSHNMYLTLAVESFFLVPIFLVLILCWLTVRVFKSTESYVLRAFPVFVIFFMVGNDVLYYKYFWYCTLVFSLCLGNEFRARTEKRGLN